MLKKKVPEIKEAMTMLDILSRDKEAMEISEIRFRAMLNENTNIEGAKMDGLQQGLEQGLQQTHDKIVVIAKKMKQKGNSLEDIAEITGLTVSEIKKL